LGPETRPEWARECVWDCRDPADCVPLQLFTAEDRVLDEICYEFFAVEGTRMRWPDREMLHQLAGGTGLEC
jgi:hypothetical protein